jgi:membrane-associated protease RseP (regulator of RpoE activity)
MTLMLGILLGLFVLVLLVVLHELGHAIVARRNGVVVR